MTEPPERIFATCTGGRHWVEIRVGEYQTEYIRADVATAQIAERDARIAELEEAANKLERIRAMCNQAQEPDDNGTQGYTRMGIWFPHERGDEDSPKP